MMGKTVAVLLPVHVPGSMFRELIRRLSRQSHVPEKVIIINTIDPEKDCTLFLDSLAEEFEGSFGCIEIYHIQKSEFGHGKTRDMGIRRAGTDLVLCMTQDALPKDRHLVEKLEDAFDDPSVAAAYGRQLAGKKSDILEREAREFNYPAGSKVMSAADLETMGVKTFFCSDVCAMWRVETYEELGGFEKDVIFNEDMIFAGKLIRAGYRIAYCADAQVYHHHNYGAMKQLRRNFDLGVSQAQHPEIFRMASSGKEGIRFVRQTSGDLIRSGRADQLGRFFWQSGCKYLGYQLGKRYRSLPEGVISRLTDSPQYWGKPKS